MPASGSHQASAAPPTMTPIATTSATRTGLERLSMRESSSRSAVMVTTRNTASHGIVSETGWPVMPMAAATAQPAAARPISVLCVDAWIWCSRP